VLSLIKKLHINIYLDCLFFEAIIFIVFGIIFAAGSRMSKLRASYYRPEFKDLKDVNNDISVVMTIGISITLIGLILFAILFLIYSFCLLLGLR
jgi:hypothetical protein